MEELTDYYPLGKSSFLDTQEKLTDFTVYDEDKKILRELAKEKQGSCLSPPSSLGVFRR